jgi:hypothetical protein
MKVHSNMFIRYILVIVYLLFLIGCTPAGQEVTGSVTAPVQEQNITLAGVGIPGDGNVIALGLVDTIRYLRMTMQAAPNTFIMVGPNGEYFFAWAMKSNVWGFMGLTPNGAPLMDPKAFCGGNYSNCLTFAGLVKYLETIGWTYATPSQLPPWLVTALTNTQQFLLNYSAMLVTPAIFIVPGTTLPDLMPLPAPIQG